MWRLVAIGLMGCGGAPTYAPLGLSVRNDGDRGALSLNVTAGTVMDSANPYLMTGQSYEWPERQIEVGADVSVLARFSSGACTFGPEPMPATRLRLAMVRVNGDCTISR